MAALSVQVPYPVFYDRDGVPLDNGNIYIGVANLDPVTNPIQVYYDEALTLTASQPLITSNGYVYRNGTPTSLYVNASYSLRVQNANSTTVYNVAEVDQPLPAIQVADSMAELRLISSGQLVAMSGYYTPGDGGGGSFFWDGTSTATDDAGLVVNPTGNVGAGRWLRIVDTDLVNVRAWGAKNEEDFDNRPAFQAAIDALTVDSYSYSVMAAGYGKLNPSGLYVGEGRWDFLTVHPTASDRILWMRKPMRIQCAGQDRMQFVPKIASGVKWWLVAEVAGPGYVGVDYAIGGGICDFGFTGGESTTWQNCIKVTAASPSAWDAFKIERFFMFEVSNGIELNISGGTTNYGVIVQEGKILSIASGGNGIYDLGAYNYFANMDIYEDVTISGSTCVRAYGSAATWINVRVQGTWNIDAPLAQFLGCGVEYCAFPNAGGEIVRVNRVGQMSSFSMISCFHRQVTSLTRISATVAECTTTTPHLLTTGDQIKYEQAVPAAYNAPTGAITVMSPTVFRYPLTVDPVTNATENGWFSVITGSQVAYGITIYGQDVRLERVTFLGGQPAYPISWSDGSSGVIDGCSSNITPYYPPDSFISATNWRALRISNSPSITQYGWETRTITSLPPAVDLARGIQRLVLGGVGVADSSVVCRKDASGVFAWVSTI